MKLLTVTLFFVVFGYTESPHQRQSNLQDFRDGDTLFIQAPLKYDTAHVRFSHPSITRIILGKWNLPGYSAPGAISLDILRYPDFIRNCESSEQRMNTRVLWPEKLSDSLLLLNRAFFKRHTFFVIITRGDSCYFYKAKGEYMYKNFSAEGAN